MKRSKRLATTAIALALPAALLLTSCAAAGDANEGQDSADEGNTLTVWTWDPAFNIYAMEEAEKVYQQDNPDFELEVVEVPWEDLQTRLTTIAQSQAWGELPDIFLMQNNAFQKNGINYPDLFSDLGGADIDFSQFPESVVAYSTLDGVNYGVPFDSGTAVTALRTDILGEAGYTLDDFTDIDWNTFIAQGQDVLSKTGKPLLSGPAGSSDLVVMMLQSAGASLFDEDGNPTIVDNDALNGAIDAYTQLVETGVFLEVNSWDEYVGSFVNGNVAGTQQGVWIVGSIQTAEDQSGSWGITNVPSLDGVTGATNYTANGGSSWAVSSNADVELASDFLASTFAGSTELYDIILPASGAVANWIPAGDSPVYAEPVEFFGGEAVFAKVVEFGSEVPSNNTGAYYYEGRDAVSAAITQILNGADRDTALAEAQANVEFAMQ
ncbi:ABC transporter substrate-binding protein [Agromyces silvae]|uniref:ABC transporter substrate-binding protein n=1 Tax=Agromyces silvae TaxID=3388266 RepID=UPI00280B124C|nr:extracellular solute-binding protein [Agromyces protaetiae]